MFTNRIVRPVLFMRYCVCIPDRRPEARTFNVVVFLDCFSSYSLTPPPCWLDWRRWLYGWKLLPPHVSAPFFLCTRSPSVPFFVTSSCSCSTVVFLTVLLFLSLCSPSLSVSRLNVCHDCPVAPKDANEKVAAYDEYIRHPLLSLLAFHAHTPSYLPCSTPHHHLQILRIITFSERQHLIIQFCVR